MRQAIDIVESCFAALHDLSPFFFATSVPGIRLGELAGQ